MCTDTIDEIHLRLAEVGKLEIARYFDPKVKFSSYTLCHFATRPLLSNGNPDYVVMLTDWSHSM